MSERNQLEGWSRRKLLVAGILSGTGLGVSLGTFGLCYVHLTPLPSDLGNSTRFVETCTVSSDRLLDSLVVAFGTAEPTHSLRLLQAIGILLPLFTGLLRFTTDSSSGVSSNANGL